MWENMQVEIDFTTTQDKSGSKPTNASVLYKMTYHINLPDLTTHTEINSQPSTTPNAFYTIKC